MNEASVISNALTAGAGVHDYPRTMGEYKIRWQNAGDDYLASPEAKAFRIYAMMAAQDVDVSPEMQTALYYAITTEDLTSGIREESRKS